LLQQYTIYETSRKLGISESAVRQRIHRGTLESGKDENGRLVVYLESNGTDATNYNDDTSPVMRDYVTALKSQIETLEADKEHLREESIRKDTIIMSLTKRIPAIEAPEIDTQDLSEPRESSVTATEDTVKDDVPVDSVDGQNRQSWWQRWFGT
jgi:hypothetical protein